MLGDDVTLMLVSKRALSLLLFSVIFVVAISVYVVSYEPRNATTYDCDIDGTITCSKINVGACVHGLLYSYTVKLTVL
jgi:hypothetical protein